MEANRNAANGLKYLDNDEISNTTNCSIRIPGVNRGMKVVSDPVCMHWL